MKKRCHQATALLSPCRTYRYELVRAWDDSKPLLTWCMLNPSTADETVDDPTIRKCIGFADRWGYGSIRVVNLFALRATEPRELKWHPDPVGPENESVLSALTGDVVAAWGGSIPRTPRADILARLALRSARWCLGTTRAGEPRHPLMLGYAAERQSFGLGNRKDQR